MPRGSPTTAVPMRIPNDLLEFIDADLERRGKPNRQAWIVDALTRTMKEIRARQEYEAAHPVRSHPKPGAKQ